MNRFEFLISFISIVCGLALTTFLSRAISLIVNRRNIKGYWPHLVWCFNWYSYMLLDWWFIFSWSEKQVTYYVYSFYYLKASIMVAISYILLPGKSENDMERYFQSVRPIFFSLLLVFILSDLGDTALHGSDNWRSMEGVYFGRVAFTASLCFASIFIRNRNAQTTIGLVMMALGTFLVANL